MRRYRVVVTVFLMVFAVTFIGCEGPVGPQGERGLPGEPVLAINTVNADPIELEPADTSIISVTYSYAEDGTLSFEWSAEAGTVIGDSAVVRWVAPETGGWYVISVSISDGEHEATGHVTVRVTGEAGNDMGTGYLYVADRTCDRIYKFDLSTGTNLGAVLTDVIKPCFLKISADNTHLFVVEENEGFCDGSLRIVNVPTSAEEANIPLGVNPKTCAVTNDGSEIYVNGGGWTPQVYVIDGMSFSVTDNIYYSSGGWSAFVLLSPDENYLYAGATATNNIAKIDRVSHTVVNTFSTDVDELDEATINPDGSHIYVSGAWTTILQSINTTTGSVDGEINLGTGSHAQHGAIDGAGQYLWLPIVNEDAIKVIDLSTFTVSHTIDIVTPRQIVFSDDGYPYVIAVNRAYRFDPVTFAQLGCMELGEVQGDRLAYLPE